jgi:hypothetical protein
MGGTSRHRLQSQADHCGNVFVADRARATRTRRAEQTVDPRPRKALASLSDHVLAADPAPIGHARRPIGRHQNDPRAEHQRQRATTSSSCRSPSDKTIATAALPRGTIAAAIIGSNNILRV